MGAGGARRAGGGAPVAWRRGRPGAGRACLAAWWGALVAGALLAPVPAGADLTLPAGFVAETYVTGHGFDAGGERGGRGFPSASTLGIDPAGMLYLARTGARWRGGEVDDLGPLWRIPVGGAHLSPETESRFLHGPPFPNPQVATAAGARSSSPPTTATASAGRSTA